MTWAARVHQETAIEEARAKAAEKGESYTVPEVKDEDYIARGLARILGVEEETIRQHAALHEERGEEEIHE